MDSVGAIDDLLNDFQEYVNEVKESHSRTHTPRKAETVTKHEHDYDSSLIHNRDSITDIIVLSDNDNPMVDSANEATDVTSSVPIAEKHDGHDHDEDDGKEDTDDTADDLGVPVSVSSNEDEEGLKGTTSASTEASLTSDDEHDVKEVPNTASDNGTGRRGGNDEASSIDTEDTGDEAEDEIVATVPMESTDGNDDSKDSNAKDTVENDAEDGDVLPSTSLSLMTSALTSIASKLGGAIQNIATPDVDMENENAMNKVTNDNDHDTHHSNGKKEGNETKINVEAFLAELNAAPDEQSHVKGSNLAATKSSPRTANGLDKAIWSTAAPVLTPNSSEQNSSNRRTVRNPVTPTHTSKHQITTPNESSTTPRHTQLQNSNDATRNSSRISPRLSNSKSSAASSAFSSRGSNSSAKSPASSSTMTPSKRQLPTSPTRKTSGSNSTKFSPAAAISKQSSKTSTSALSSASSSSLSSSFSSSPSDDKRKLRVAEKEYHDDYESWANKTWTVHKIHDRRFNTIHKQWEFLIEWVGINPKTRKPWELTWEPCWYVAADAQRKAFYLTFLDKDIPLISVPRISNMIVRVGHDKTLQDQILSIYEKEGVVHIPCGLTPSEIEACRNEVNEIYERRLKMATERHGLRDGERDEYVDFKTRTANRIDLRLDPSKFMKLLPKTPCWMSLVTQMLDNEEAHAELVHVGCMISLPGATNQPFHQDGPHHDLENDCPTYAVNVFIPLVDLTDAIGRTQFVPRSFLLEQFDYAERRIDESVMSTKEFIQCPAVKAGECVIFDYRLKHRGVRNNAGYQRELLYLTYAVPPFRDVHNFSSDRYKPPLEPMESEMNENSNTNHSNSSSGVYSSLSDTDTDPDSDTVGELDGNGNGDMDVDRRLSSDTKHDRSSSKKQGRKKIKTTEATIGY